MTEARDIQETQNASSHLRALYFSRTTVQLLWAAVVISFSTTSPLFALILMIAYPLWDVACTIFDRSSSDSSDSTASSKNIQSINIALGVATAIVIAVGARSDIRYAVAAFGAWAFAAGLLQLGVGIYRRALIKGQWPMILSGLQSMAAGVAFLLGGLAEKVHVKDLGGYAVFGGIYFLISALLLGRKSLSPSTSAAGTTAIFLLAATIAPRVGHAQTTKKVDTVILVHGAWADGSSWSKVISLLKAEGLRVVAVQLPLTSLANDVSTVQRALALEDGPVLLVGHSYGGVVITQVGIDPKVVGLVYVAAFAPDVNQSVVILNAQFPATPITNSV